MSRFDIQTESVRASLASFDNIQAEIVGLKNNTASVMDNLKLSGSYSSTIKNSLSTVIANMSKCASSVEVLHGALSNTVASYLSAESNVLNKITDGKFSTGVAAMSGTAIGSQVGALNTIQSNTNGKSSKGGGNGALGSGAGGGFRGEEALDDNHASSDKSGRQSTKTENTTHEPLYISNPTSELDSIENKMRNAKNYDDLTWNNPYENGVHSISCVWFSNEKVKMRGLSIENAEVGSSEYQNWIQSNFSSNNYPQTVVDYIKSVMKQKNVDSLYNVYIEGDTSSNNPTHTMLIDKAYYDSNGKLHLLFSDNKDISKGTFVHTTNLNVNTAYHVMSQTDLVEDSFVGGTSNWSINGIEKKPNKIICYGQQ